MDYQERTYHGLQGDAVRRQQPPRSRRRFGRPTPGALDEDEWLPPVILVEAPESGPTERESVEMLREILPPEYGDFGWGYNGTGTSNAAIAVLSDALDVDPDVIGLGAENVDGAELREAFCVEVLTDFCDEWRLNRRAVLRWAAGWYHQRGVTPVPDILRDPVWAQSLF
ncbi:DUF6166 domain-containing protein [Parafrankia sp. FMc2]|uniref:DUF6166 domain-containing protein n=1 Tax=Parafrankia sp. FMc2 TaxID=3233196 RepID=UPI0034D53A42